MRPVLLSLLLVFGCTRQPPTDKPIFQAPQQPVAQQKPGAAQKTHAPAPPAEKIYEVVWTGGMPGGNALSIGVPKLEGSVLSYIDFFTGERVTFVAQGPGFMEAHESVREKAEEAKAKGAKSIYDDLK